MAAGIILDVDGTLVDSNDAHARAWQAALAEHGFQVDLPRIRRLIGMGGDRLLPAVTGLSERSPLGTKIGDRRGAIFKERFLATLQPFPQVRELLVALKERGYQLVVASSAAEDELGPLLERANVADLIASQTSSDDAEESKPAPDIVTAALEQLGLPPEQTLMIGDTPYDVRAARAAKVPIIAVESGGWPQAQLRDAQAVYADAAALLADLANAQLP